tara:strand:+ start:555 stop:1571 length:1017 start_codon:yes stop_codon:yes gene_type:complete
MGITPAAQLVTQITRGSDLDDVFSVVRHDFEKVDALIPRQMTSDIALVSEIGRYIVDSGGKRLRPLIVLLVARASGYQGDAHVRLATLVEFLHTATLLHDDVVDRSGRRRGRATANALWGNAPSVLVGDFLYSRAFQLMVDLDSMDLMAIISDATNVIAEGEVLQLENIGNAELSENDYLEIIRCKSALLFQAAAHTAIVLSNDDPDTISGYRNFGLHFGLAYQLVDDWLDYAGDSQLMGKNVGDDLAEGKVTLPLIATIKEGSRQEATLVRNAISSRSDRHLSAVIKAVCRSGALDYTKSRAEEEAGLALDCLASLPRSVYRDALENLTTFATSRMR